MGRLASRSVDPKNMEDHLDCMPLEAHAFAENRPRTGIEPHAELAFSHPGGSGTGERIA